MTANVRGVGVIKDISAAGDGQRRTATGAYRWRIAMVFTLEGHRVKRSSKIHEVPQNKTHLVQVGARCPVLGDPKHGSTLAINWQRFVRIDGRKALNAIIAQLAPTLREGGFRKTSPRTFNHALEGGVVHVIEFQPDRDGGAFTVNVGVYVPARVAGHAKKAAKNVQCTDCPHRLCWRLGQLVPNVGSDRWWRYDDASAAVAEVDQHLERIMRTHLKRFASHALLQTRWREAKARKNPRMPLR